jgi:hypothetical protein
MTTQLITAGYKIGSTKAAGGYLVHPHFTAILALAKKI